MPEKFVCKTCGAASTEKGHLCAPAPVTCKCPACGATAENARHLCKPMLGRVAYVCEACGRPAENADLLCKPKPIPQG